MPMKQIEADTLKKTIRGQETTHAPLNINIRDEKMQPVDEFRYLRCYSRETIRLKEKSPHDCWKRHWPSVCFGMSYGAEKLCHQRHIHGLAETKEAHFLSSICTNNYWRLLFELSAHSSVTRVMPYNRLR